MSNFHTFEIVDIRPRHGLEAAWQDLIFTRCYSILDDVLNSYMFCHPSRSCDALAFANLQGRPWRDNKIPRSLDLAQLQDWLRPLVKEEGEGLLTGKPCR